MNNFNLDKQRGKVGEQMFAEMQRAYGRQVIDVSEAAEYQGKDIDFIVISASGSSATVEVKTDYASEKTGNIYIEEYNFRSGNEGWINYTAADYLVFVQPTAAIAHIVPTDTIRKKLTAFEIRNSTNTIGRLIPIVQLKQLDGYQLLRL